jgi:hypothetical protein
VIYPVVRDRFSESRSQDADGLKLLIRRIAPPFPPLVVVTEVVGGGAKNRSDGTALDKWLCRNRLRLAAALSTDT